jgi:hypothetical protein
MSVLGVAEQSEMDLVRTGSTVPRPRLAAPRRAAGRRTGPAAAGNRPACGAGFPAPGQAPAGPQPGDRELRVRQVRVSELRVREQRTGRGQRRAATAPSMPVRTRELRSLAVESRELTAGGTRAVGSGDARGGGLRLTRRGRFVLAVFAVLAAVGLVTLFWLTAAGGAQASSHGLRPGAPYRGMAQVVVRPGQTLWSIAQRAEPAADPRIVVQQIIEFNALSGPVIQPGESLWVPKG